MRNKKEASELRFDPKLSVVDPSGKGLPKLALSSSRHDFSCRLVPLMSLAKFEHNGMKNVARKN